MKVSLYGDGGEIEAMERERVRIVGEMERLGAGCGREEKGDGEGVVVVELFKWLWTTLR